MLTESDIIEIFRKLKSLRARAYFFFKDFKYILVMSGLIHACDKSLQAVEWPKAFGSKTPNEVLNSLLIEKIEVYMRKRSEPQVFYSLKDFLDWLSTMS